MRYISRIAVRLQMARDEAGQGLAEYGLILGLIAIVCIAALTTLGGGVNTQLGNVNNAL